MTRQQDVADLREVGMSWSYIANRLGISEFDARRVADDLPAKEVTPPAPPSREELLRRRARVEARVGTARTVGDVWRINDELAEIDDEISTGGTP